jgi:GTPase SAR1 family protein
MTDGHVEDMLLTRQSLKRFIADSDFDTETVKYLCMELPIDILKNKVMLIDTPGVDDLNQQRVEVTYGFIPRADAVIFLLNATTPMRRTEKEFLNETILKEGSDQIIFVANYFDYVDEDEQDDIMDEIKRRIQIAIGKKDPLVYPLSAIKALDARLSGNQKALEDSGILQIEAEIKKLIENGSREHQKIRQFKNRLNHILYDINQEISSMLSICSASLEQLNEELEQIDKYVDKQANRRIILEEYTEEREKEITAIIYKSIYNFGEYIREMVITELDNFTGLDIKNFIEKQLPLKIQREIKQWYERYSSAIHTLLQKFEKALVIGLAKEFNTGVVKLDIVQDNQRIVYFDVNPYGIYCDDISKTPITAGFIAGGASLATIFLGVPILFPIVGMAGFPIIQKMLAEKKLQQAKDKLRPMLNYALDDLIFKFQESIEDMVYSSVRDIKRAAVKRFDDQIKYMQIQVQEEIKERREDSKQETMRIEQLNKIKMLIESLINKD